jgi:hypothetical protein
VIAGLFGRVPAAGDALAFTLLRSPQAGFEQSAQGNPRLVPAQA